MATASSNDLSIAWKDLEAILHAGPKGKQGWRESREAMLFINIITF